MRKICFLLIIMFALNFFNLFQNTFVQAQTEIMNQEVTFHHYSLDYKAINGSYYIYNGADPNKPRLQTAFQVSPNAQISGLVTTFGFEWLYWSGAIIWTYNLQDDLHVKGIVEMTVYMSSNDLFSGLFVGGGYGMGLVEMDRNRNEINRFLTEGDPTIGSNPLSPIPKAYSLSIPIDHIFSKENTLGFFVGVGGTKPGYNFTAYFDSTEKNSGAILPLVTSPNSTPFPTISPTATPSLAPSPTQDSTLPSGDFNEAEENSIIFYGAIGTIVVILLVILLFRFRINKKRPCIKSNKEVNKINIKRRYFLSDLIFLNLFLQKQILRFIYDGICCI